jgi:ParB-like chromosome segregation protein Spo0J
MINIHEVEISILTLLEDNPRTITKEAMEHLCESIKKDPDFLWRRPILVDHAKGKLTVYAGNQRVAAAKWLGWDTIPCIVDSDVPEDVKKFRILIDNRHSGDWDDDILANIYSLDDLYDAGFTPEELELNPKNSSDNSEKDLIDEKCEMCGKKLTKRKR